ncbi:MAG: ATP synthase F1 subunit epsilon [Oscillospiraceae bacterium]|jgi:F-type H+-transporting ATPase subunit epsilon|nr:ATP synthase F1 subunit epsilon [Oscillospiraceae bacterium]
MPTPFQLDILTPERSFFSGEAQGVIVTTPDGELCVLAHHAPMVTPVTVDGETGSFHINIDGVWKMAFISEGFMEVGHNRTVIFTQACEWPEDIDVQRAEEVKRRTEEKLRQQLSIREYRTNKIALARAMARLRIAHTQNLNK